MTATNHALTGTAIALIVKQPALAIPLAFLSHFVTDAIPHSLAEGMSEKAARRIADVDGVLAIGLTLIVSIAASQVSFWLMIFCALAAFGPDFIWIWRYYKLGSINKVTHAPMSKFSRFHQKIQWSESRKGYLVELVWFAVVMYIILQNL